VLLLDRRRLGPFADPGPELGPEPVPELDDVPDDVPDDDVPVDMDRRAAVVGGVANENADVDDDWLSFKLDLGMLGDENWPDLMERELKLEDRDSGARGGNDELFLCWLGENTVLGDGEDGKNEYAGAQ